MADRVLVTGISGFLGGHVALALLNAGYLVRGSLRDMSRAEKVRAALRRASASGNVEALEFVSLDLLSDAGWREAMAGCRYLQHVASPFVVEMPKDKDELIRPAVEGTRRALTAALAEGVERIVLTSSAAAIVYGHDPARTAPFTEADWSETEGRDVTAYTESKTRAELEAWSIMEAAGRRHDLVVVNPTFIVGPLLDDDPGTSGRLLKRLLDGSIPAAAKVYFNGVDVRDVAELQLKAMESPEAGGKRFIASSGVMSLLEIADVLRAEFPAYARKLPRFEVPNWLVRLFAFVDPEMRGNIGSLGIVRRTDPSAGRALLGHPFIPAPDAAVAMARSLIEHHLV
jgi:dihydroflavonol-4-reductase